MSSDIKNALKTAHYQDVLIVTLDEDEASSCISEHVLVASLDKDNGGIRWVDINSEASSCDVGIQRHLQTKKWFMPMLKDAHRNKLYDEAIMLACKDLIAKCHDSLIRTLDIGSGTGLLAMITARHLTTLLQQQESLEKSNQIQVLSLEMSSAMTRLACNTIESNAFSKSDPICNIQILENHSCHAEFPYTFQLCTSELLESGLLGEGLLPAIRDAWERHLDVDAIVVPQRARIYVQVVEGRCVEKYSKPQILCNGIHLMPSQTSTNSCFGCIVPVHAEAFLLGSDYIPCFESEEKLDKIQFLSQTILAFDFDFSSKNNFPPIDEIVRRHFIASRSGVAHGVLFWWECDLYKNCTYSTEPGNSPWQDHWLQCFYVFPQDRNNSHSLTKGAEYTLICSRDDYRVSFHLEKLDSELIDSNVMKRPKLDVEAFLHTFENVIAPNRSLQLNCSYRLEIIQSAIEYALKVKGKSASFLDVSDFSLCSMIAAICFGATKVTSVESSLCNLPLFSATVAQVYNNLPKPGSEFVILNAHAESLLLDHIVGGPAQIVCSEPYYQVLEGWHLLEALNYFFLLKMMKLRGIIQNDALCIPTQAVLVGCAIELDSNFLNSYTGIHEILGFDHENVNRYTNRFHEYDLIFPLWQYKFKRLTKTIEVAKIHYQGSSEKMTIEGDHNWVFCPFYCEGSCSAFAYWVEYHLAVSKDTYKILSTGDHYHQQAIRMLPQPHLVGPDKTFQIRFSISSDEQKDYDWEFGCS